MHEGEGQAESSPLKLFSYVNRNDYCIQQQQAQTNESCVWWIEVLLSFLSKVNVVSFMFPILYSPNIGIRNWHRFSNTDSYRHLKLVARGSQSLSLTSSV